MTLANSHRPEIESWKDVQLRFVTINCGELPFFGSAMQKLSGPNSPIEVRELGFHRDQLVDDFPLLWCPARPIDALEMNLFMEHRYRGNMERPKRGGGRNFRGGVTVKTLRSIANSLRGFLAWLADTDTDWRETSAVADSDRAKAWLPVYRYRAHLISRVESRALSHNSATLYINHVRQFYEWAVRTERIRRVPFTYKFVPIKKQRKDGSFDLLFSSAAWGAGKSLMAQTSDLTIPKKFKAKSEALDDSLAPFSSEELKWLLGSNHMQLESRRLWAHLALVCGLRAHEVAALPEDAVVQPNRAGAAAFHVRVLGKGNKERTVLVPKFLMEKLNDYKNAEQRLYRAAKWDLEHGSAARPLFLNRSGQPIKSASLTNLTSCVKRELSASGVNFQRSFHDLRATFATTLAKFMLDRQMKIGFIQYKLMALLGHENFSTTQKYINFARSVTFEQQMNDWVEQIFGGLGAALDLEDKTGS